MIAEVATFEPFDCVPDEAPFQAFLHEIDFVHTIGNDRRLIEIYGVEALGVGVHDGATARLEGIDDGKLYLIVEGRHLVVNAEDINYEILRSPADDADDGGKQGSNFVTHG